MPTLPDDVRNRLEKAVIAARDKAEEGARAALQRLYVDSADSKAIPASFPDVSRKLRVHLRAHARQLGDQVPQKGTQTISRLVAECAYEFWHRMLFARFLAENQLLIHPEHKVSMSLEECQELAIKEGTDGWTFASRCAARMLPQIFRPDDPLLQMPFAPEHKLALEQILAELPADIFTADDSLGWVYQFWQTNRKEEVNKSEVKIGGDELPAVTQLFTEHYMVLFLLHNTLGAWWVNRQAASRGCKQAEVTLPGYTFEYLRFRDDGTPAAGTFPGWPATCRELKVLDPCCGSGHFLVAAFELLVRIRMHDDGLSPRDACDAVLRDNLSGLELDARCTQIAAFNLAFAGWKFQQAHTVFDPRRLEFPQMHIACSGHAPKGRREDWLRLANGNSPLKWGMELLWDTFHQANDLGSLIDPRATTGSGSAIVAGFEQLQPLLRAALEREDIGGDAELTAAGVAAQGIAGSAQILAGQYHLVVTNVPYLGRAKHAATLQAYCEDRVGKADLATVFVERCLGFCLEGATSALVTPQFWLFLKDYLEIRAELLKQETWDFVARLGPGAFERISGENVSVALFILGRQVAEASHEVAYLDVSAQKSAKLKSEQLRMEITSFVSQKGQLSNPEHRFTGLQHIPGKLLRQYATPTEGMSTGDESRYIQKFWEQARRSSQWEWLHTAPEATCFRSGLTDVVRWEERRGPLASADGARIQGDSAWGKPGVLIARVGKMRASLYDGVFFNKNCVVLTPRNTAHLSAIWAYATSPEFIGEVRKLDKKTYITTAVFGQIPFHLACWQAAADAAGRLPEPHSGDPTQWLFKGELVAADAPHNLQVALARLLGYRWPDQAADKLNTLTDNDGIVCLPAIGTQKAAAERLRGLLAAAYGADWSPARQEGLLAAVGFGGKTLHDWLRDGFFEQHCKLFHNRPFLWHIWDGRKDGFSAIVNYHKFDEPRLRDLIYHQLAEWIKRQVKAVEKGESGADARLAAALELQKKLKLIHEGEKPYDIFVRWKPLDKQPIGWAPDLNDGVRLNIRPFVAADILRKKPNIKWNKDKGRDPESAPWYGKYKDVPNYHERDRINDYHLTLEEKRKAREDHEKHEKVLDG